MHASVFVSFPTTWCVRIFQATQRVQGVSAALTASRDRGQPPGRGVLRTSTPPTSVVGLLRRSVGIGLRHPRFFPQLERTSRVSKRLYLSSFPMDCVICTVPSWFLSVWRKTAGFDCVTIPVLGSVFVFRLSLKNKVVTLNQKSQQQQESAYESGKQAARVSRVRASTQQKTVFPSDSTPERAEG